MRHACNIATNDYNGLQRVPAAPRNMNATQTRHGVHVVNENLASIWLSAAGDRRPAPTIVQKHRPGTPQWPPPFAEFGPGWPFHSPPTPPPPPGKPPPPVPPNAGAL